MNIDEMITLEPYKSCYEYGYEQGSCDQYSLAVNKARADERAKVEEMLSELPTVNGYIDSAYLWMKWEQLKSGK